MRRKTCAINDLAIQTVYLILLIFVFAAAPCSGAKECPTREGVILAGIVNVNTACRCCTYESEEDSEDGPDGFCDCEIVAEKKGKVYKSSVMGSFRILDNNPVAYIKELTNWRDGYLFVPYNGGGGNAWRGIKKYVFAVRKGELVSIGSVRDEGGKEFDGGFFYDVYDKLEYTPLTSHADSPCFTVVMTERNGNFVADLDRTWQINNEPPEYWSHRVTSGLFSNAVLARYCKRDQELKLVIATGKETLSTEDFDVFQKIVQDVVPGEIPGPPLKERRPAKPRKPKKLGGPSASPAKPADN